MPRQPHPNQFSEGVRSGSYSNVTSHWDEIKLIGYSREGQFYDLHVPGDNHYSAHGLWHHNSGKSFIIDRDYIPRYHYALVDSDAIASLMSYGVDPECRHCLAKDIADFQARQFLDASISFVLHCTGASYEKCASWLHNARIEGFRTKIVHVVCPQELAAQRNAERGWKVQSPMFEERWRLADMNIPKLLPLADEVVEVNNGAVERPAYVYSMLKPLAEGI